MELEPDDDGTVRVFGFDHPNLKRTVTPIGEPCMLEDGYIEDGNMGFTLIFNGPDGVKRVPYHRMCLLKSLGLIKPETAP
jgi:hypothetical protein